MVEFIKSDGGKGDYRCTVADCAIRAVAIALKIPFEDAVGEHSRWLGTTAHEINRRFVDNMLDDWTWHPSTARMDSLPKGRIVVRSIEHYACFIDGVLHDTYNCTHGGERQICEYWRKE